MKIGTELAHFIHVVSTSIVIDNLKVKKIVTENYDEYREELSKTIADLHRELLANKEKYAALIAHVNQQQAALIEKLAEQRDKNDRLRDKCDKERELRYEAELAAKPVCNLL